MESMCVNFNFSLIGNEVDKMDNPIGEQAAKRGGWRGRPLSQITSSQNISAIHFHTSFIVVRWCVLWEGVGGERVDDGQREGTVAG